MAGDAGEKVNDLGIIFPGEESMVPFVHYMGFCDSFDITEIHQHAIGWRCHILNDISPQSDLQHVAVTMKVSALAQVIGNAMSGIEFKAAGDLHEGGCYA